MFDGIAKRYDLLNRLTTFGIDRLWRQKAIGKLNLHSNHTVLDLAAGTLDISATILKRYPSVRVIAADPSKEMMKMGRTKLSSSSRIQLMASVGEQLPFIDRSLDAAIIAFGIRNFANRAQSLKQLANAIRPGGRLVILELSIPQKGMLAPMAALYIQKIIPLLGKLLSSEDEYAYLPESMKHFPQPDFFQKELQAAGFDVIETTPFMSGACTLFVSSRRN